MLNLSAYNRRWVLTAAATFTFTGLAGGGLQFTRSASKLPEPLSSMLQLFETALSD
jgi:hypothetical protein